MGTDTGDVPRRAWELREDLRGRGEFTTRAYLQELALAVHDEIVVECDAGQAEAVGAWVARAMKDAMAPLVDPVPVEVEVRTAQTWGGD